MKNWFLILTVCLLACLAGCAQNGSGNIPPEASDGPESLQASVDAAAPADAPDPVGPASLGEDAGGTGKLDLYELAGAAPAVTVEDIRKIRFEDVPADDERADFISYAACFGYLLGTDDGKFLPDGFVTRGDLMAVLHRLSGAEKSNLLVLTPDVDANAWYAEAVSWALENEIASGGEDGNFAPEKYVTREELAVFLYRFAAEDGARSYDESLVNYRDGGTIQSYARAALAWALENRIFAGMVGDTVHPFLPVSRGQLAQVLTALAAYSSGEPAALELTEKLSVETAGNVSTARHEDIQQKINAVAEKYGAAGVQAAVIENGRLADTYAYGWAVKDSAPMTADHKIRIASLTKAGIGIAAMVLYEDGVIDLDESIGTYWGVQTRNPCYPDDPVTVRSLLTHTSSIPVLGDDASRSYEAVRSRLASNSYSKVQPGAAWAWAYNNYAYGVLGQTLELASGMYLDDIMRQRLWDIMEIDAAFESGNIRDKSMLATVYQYGGVGRSAASMANNVRKGEPGATGIYFSGGMTISASDMGKMVALLANGGCYEGLHLLKQSTVDAMQARCETPLDDGSYQALALRSQDDIYGRDRLFYHTGSAYGVFNLISYDPDARDGVVVFSTGASGVKDSRNIYAVCGEISEFIYDIIA